MASYKEIVTKAVIGKGKKHFKDKYFLETEFNPTTILGCWVINHRFKGYKSGDKVGVDGSFDINIWYSYDKDTKTAVINKKIEYKEYFMNDLVKESMIKQEKYSKLIDDKIKVDDKYVNISDYIKADLEKEALSLIEDITDKMSELITRAKYSVITYYYDELFNRTVDEYLNDKKVSEEKIDAIIEMNKNLGIPLSLKEYGLDEQIFMENVDALADKAFSDQCTTANPRLPLVSEIKQLLIDAYYGNLENLK